MRHESVLANSWVRRWSAAKSSHYYVNMYSRTSTWQEPPSAAALIYVETGPDGKLVAVGGVGAGPLAASADSSVYLQKWSAAKSAVYFVNVASGKAVWTLPLGATVLPS